MARLAYLGTKAARIEEKLKESAFCELFGCDSMTFASYGFGSTVGRLMDKAQSDYGYKEIIYRQTTR